MGGGQTLYNGIKLPQVWPPRLKETPKEAVTPAYLLNPPAVIPIDVGRQLFVDDFLIEHTTLRRTYHLAEYHPQTPVLRPDRPWEGKTAMVFSDGVWYDPQDELFKMWYLSGALATTCYATSADGLHWEKPKLDVKPGTNVVQTGRRDSSTVWLDLEEKDPRRRYKMFRSCLGGSTVKWSFGLATFFSADGIHWSEPPLLTGACGDRSTVFWNPFRKVWAYSLRHGWGRPRRRRYWERNDLDRSPIWRAIDEPPMWVGADAQDPMRDDLRMPTELYNLDAVAYESILLGLFTIWRGQPAKEPGRDKPNDVVLAYSRDGWSWHRPDRRAFCGVSESPDAWNYGNVQSAGGGCLVVDEQLYFYVSGRAKLLTTGLATLRRDGFASMDAITAEGTLTTRPVRFRGKHLFVNLAAGMGKMAGEMAVEVLDQGGTVIPPFSRGNCIPSRTDSTRQAVRWQGATDLQAVAGRNVKFRFHLRNGRLFAFWVSPAPSGASYGYVAAGGPGFAGAMDKG